MAAVTGCFAIVVTPTAEVGRCEVRCIPNRALMHISNVLMLYWARKKGVPRQKQLKCVQ